MIKSRIAFHAAVVALSLITGCAQADTQHSASPDQKLKINNATATASSLAEMTVFFKLDPSLTRGLYMGDRWVSPPRYMQVSQRGMAGTFRARVAGVDARRRPVAVSPQWLPSDPDRITVATHEDATVTVTVTSPGDYQLRIVDAAVTRVLEISATYDEKADSTQITVLN